MYLNVSLKQIYVVCVDYYTIYTYFCIRQAEIVHLLLDKGVDIDIYTSNGYTALDLALHIGNFNILCFYCYLLKEFIFAMLLKKKKKQNAFRKCLTFDLNQK